MPPSCAARSAGRLTSMPAQHGRTPATPAVGARKGCTLWLLLAVAALLIVSRPSHNGCPCVCRFRRCQRWLPASSLHAGAHSQAPLRANCRDPAWVKPSALNGRSRPSSTHPNKTVMTRTGCASPWVGDPGAHGCTCSPPSNRRSILECRGEAAGVHPPTHGVRTCGQCPGVPVTCCPRRPMWRRRHPCGLEHVRRLQQWVASRAVQRPPGSCGGQHNSN
jgi:hypothetical protein